jgi:hypothetical protein
MTFRGVKDPTLLDSIATCIKRSTGSIKTPGTLCEPGLSWQATMLKWFDGRVSCQETKRYLDNFFAVTRTRPEEPGPTMHSNFSKQVWCFVRSAFGLLDAWPMPAYASCIYLHSDSSEVGVSWFHSICCVVFALAGRGVSSNIHSATPPPPLHRDHPLWVLPLIQASTTILLNMCFCGDITGVFIIRCVHMQDTVV